MDYMNKFEKDKHTYVQELLKNFLLIQLSFTTQAIQVYSLAYKCLMNDNSSFNAKGFLRDIGKDLYSAQLEFKPDTLEQRRPSGGGHSKQQIPLSLVADQAADSSCRISRGLIRANSASLKSIQQPPQASTAAPPSSTSSPLMLKSQSVHHMNKPPPPPPIQAPHVTRVSMSTGLSSSATAQRLSSILNSTGDSTNLSDSVGTDKEVANRPPRKKNVAKVSIRDIAEASASDSNKSSSSQSSMSGVKAAVAQQQHAPPRRRNTTSSTTSTLVAKSPSMARARISSERAARLARNDDDLTTEDGDHDAGGSRGDRNVEDGGGDEERERGSSTQSSSVAATQFRGGSQSKLHHHYTETQL